MDLQSAMNQTPLFIFLLFLLPLLLLFKLKPKRHTLNLPPSPTKLPIIGNLHQLGKLPHRSLQALSHKHGPLMLLNLGHTPTLVVSSADIAKQMVKSHDVVFSNRAQTTATEIFFYKFRDVGFAPYGEYWRQVKKISVLELLSVKRVESFKYVRDEEVQSLVDTIRLSCLEGRDVNLTLMLQNVVNDIVSRCVLGRKAEEKNRDGVKFGEVSRQVMNLITAFCVGDFFPGLKWMDVVSGLVGRINTCFKALDSLFDEAIEEHRRCVDDDDVSDRKDFVHILLQLQKDNLLDIELTQNDIKALLLDMFVGGSDTTSTTLEWTMSELLINPDKMNKVQQEVRNVMNNKSEINMKDIADMKYLKHVIKETLRLHPPVLFLVPRETSELVKLGGYDIPEKTSVFVNVWAIQRDPKFWEKPEEFIPERFINNKVDYKGLDFEYLPFGTGRRGCPGMAFGTAVLEYVLANLLYRFDWKLNGSQELDMSESYGLTVPRKLPLIVKPMLYSP